MSQDLKRLLAAVAGGARLSAAEAEAAFGLIMDGQADDAQIASLLTALRVRGETAEELTGCARALRARMAAIAAPPGAIDVCGTGGDGARTLNVSTAVALVTAACGVPVAKHGNRGVTSPTGAADVLAALGVAADEPAGELGVRLARDGLVFLFAPRHHPGLRHAAAARASLGFRTVFNLAGPLANPARVGRQLLGVHDPAWLAPLAETLGALGSERAWVVHGMGLDELTLEGPSQVVEWRGGATRRFEVTPEAAGLPRAPVAAIRGGEAAQNAAALLALLQGETSPYRDTVLLNTAAALMVAERCHDLHDGARRAALAIDDGRAFAKLEQARKPAMLPLDV